MNQLDAHNGFDETVIRNRTTKCSVLGPLSLSEHKKHKNTETNSIENQNSVTSCLLCDEKYDVISNQKIYLAHLIVVHKIVIADIKLISDFLSYNNYWRERLKRSKIEDFVFKIWTNTGSSDKGEREEYFLLCDSLPEEKSLRETLKTFKLEQALKQQENERNEKSYYRECLFCAETIGNNRLNLINHLAFEHNFNIGQADNMVYFDEFYNKLRERFDSLKCFYCEKIFYDKHVLKEHMRKKQHRCINPQNKDFDKYYIINYLELGKDWQDIKSENDVEIGIDNNEATIEDWDEKSQIFYCLFCDLSYEYENEILSHLQAVHKFDLNFIIKKENLSFYCQVKLINYIRRQMYLNECYICKKQTSTKHELELHLGEHDFSNEFPKQEFFDQPEYYFSTFDDDDLLCLLDDDGYSKDEEKYQVIPEEYNIKVNEDLIKDFKEISSTFKSVVNKKPETN